MAINEVLTDSPKLNKAIEKIRDENQHSLFVVDAPLIIESGSYQYYNESNFSLILITNLYQVQ